MIGKLYVSVFPYYDRLLGRNSFKKRPVLVLAGPRNNDYTVLPVSTISIKSNRDLDYDVEIEPEKYPKLNLNKVCYIRTHKQTTVHRSSLTTELGDLKNDYEDLYLAVLEKVESFNKAIMDSAL